MANPSFIVGIIGNMASLLVYLAPIKTFSHIVKHRSTEEFESLPYVSTLLSSSVGIYYGVTKPGMYLLATINGLGALIQLVYVVLFLIYAPPKIRAKTAILVGVLDVGFLAAVFLVTQYTMHGDLRIGVVGFIRAGITIAMYASPLVAMLRSSLLSKFTHTHNGTFDSAKASPYEIEGIGLCSYLKGLNSFFMHA
ncbi:bidirectional sugar transporter SWEET16-like [Vitis riparia]|uniref:bidirectional sugar transporter SWEET16-like n=1 Tax=Vitis riparia TaxID=96939 RepID=UPI00155A9797|nr:bidirectional sugar transporter SWEET16-like [Vitis riparia]